MSSMEKRRHSSMTQNMVKIHLVAHNRTLGMLKFYWIVESKRPRAKKIRSKWDTSVRISVKIECIGKALTDIRYKACVWFLKWYSLWCYPCYWQCQRYAGNHKAAGFCWSNHVLHENSEAGFTLKELSINSWHLKDIKMNITSLFRSELTEGCYGQEENLALSLFFSWKGNTATGALN